MRNPKNTGLIVVTSGHSRSIARLTIGPIETDCAIGRAGIRSHKREGDGATPAGRFPLQRIFYRQDRMPRPRSRLPVTAITPDMGWNDNPLSANYNCLVTLSGHSTSKPNIEHLWRDDPLYDLIVTIGHNVAPARKNYGSAIFVHIAKANFGPTLGCIALQKEVLVRVLARVDRQTNIVIQQPGK